jgi:hypothetical protein
MFCVLRQSVFVLHAGPISFQLTESEAAVSGDLFSRILAAIYRLRTPPVPS